MKMDEQVPRNALAWIIITQFAILVPHLLRVPIWVLFVYLAAALWRGMVYQGRWSYPGRYTKMALTLSCFGGIYLYYDTFIGLEPTVGLLLIAYALKLVELVTRRDAYMVIFIAYFVCVTEFLFSQELLITAYMFLAVLLNTTSLVALHQPGQDRFMRGTLRRAWNMLWQAVPLMILLFFVFPRVGPLWSVPLKSHAAKTGVSDFMAPGDFAELSQSDEVAFRVEFDGDVPERRELYWRGLVFSVVEDETWRSLRWGEVPGMDRRPKVSGFSGMPVSYSIILEPTQQSWLFAMPYADTRDRGIMKTHDFRLVSPVKVQDQRRYEVQSWPGMPRETQLSEWRHTVETRLPPGANPRTQALAREMFAASGSDPQRFAQNVLDMFSRQDFYYTLRPPRLTDDDRMDQFLFETRRGFCEHYSAAFTWMMRAAGVPARVVAGYQGGEINPINDTVIVHQFDAHAWNEIWVSGRGWVRVDPTGAIAPSRVESGLEEALQEEGSFLANTPLSPLRFRNIDWLNTLRLRIDAVSYSWQLFVLQYDSGVQDELVEDMLGGISKPRLVAVIVLVWCLLLVPAAIALIWRRRGPKLDPATRAYREFCEKLKSIGLDRQPNEAPGVYARRVSIERPELANDVEAITRAFEALAYRNESSDVGLEPLQRRVRAFRIPGESRALKPAWLGSAS